MPRRCSSPAWLAIAVIAGCATEPDTRPETADYVIETILAPACGRGACHSSETRASNLTFDTIPEAKAALSGSSRKGDRLVVAGSPARSRIVTILSDTRKPMPVDGPLPQTDIDLISRWVADGAMGLP